jgi:hypothetical protein
MGDEMTVGEFADLSAGHALARSAEDAVGSAPRAAHPEWEEIVAQDGSPQRFSPRGGAGRAACRRAFPVARSDRCAPGGRRAVEPAAPSATSVAEEVRPRRRREF